MKRVLMVLGPGRSGTTITHLILGTLENAFSVGEVYAFFRPTRTHHFKPKCFCNSIDKPCFWRTINKKEDKFHHTLFSNYEYNFIVDESKNLNWLWDVHKWSKTYHFEVLNLLMYKEPIDQLYSYWKRGLKTNDLLKKNYFKYYKQFVDLGTPYVTILLDDLISNPEKVLSKLGMICGFEYHKGMEEFWNKPESCHLFGSLNVRKQLLQRSGNKISKTIYPEEFLAFADPILEEFNSHIEYDDLIQKIKSRSIFNIKNIEKGHITNGTKPLWYWKNKIKYKIKYHFPTKWNHEF